MRTLKPAIAAILVTISGSWISRAAELQPGTLMAWNTYLKQADLKMQERAAGHLPFLWTDESPDRAARLRRGEVVIAPVVEAGTADVPHGLVHDWIGAIFIAGATINDVRAIVHDYEKYQDIYRPVVTSSRTLAYTDMSQEFQMVMHRKVLFVSAAMQGHYRAHDVVVDAHRGYSVSQSVELREIEAHGHRNEHLLPPDTGNGFIWRICSVVRYEERDGGVYVELDAMVLTRDVPGSVAWMVNPVVHRLSINSLTTTLRQTRDAVLSSRDTFQTSTARPAQPRGSDNAKPGAE